MTLVIPRLVNLFCFGGVGIGSVGADCSGVSVVKVMIGSYRAKLGV